MASADQEKQAQAMENLEGFPPLSPLSQIMHSLTIIVVAGFDVPFDKSQTVELLKAMHTTSDPRLFSVIVTDRKGVHRWKKVTQVAYEDHIFVASFPEGLSMEDYDKHFKDYLTKVSVTPFSDNLPPWEVHAIMYPTSNGAGSLVFKFSHALGDGYSSLGSIMTLCRREDDPSLPITFPSSTSKAGRKNSWSRSASVLISWFINTVRDSAVSTLQGTFLRDDKTPIRSGTPPVGLQPMEISPVSFSLDCIKRIRSKLGATVNDVVIGILSYAIQLYIQRMDFISSGARVTALIPLNMRMLNGYQDIGDMLKANLWGNRFGLLSISLPSFSDEEKVDPLHFITSSRDNIRKKKNSAAVHFSSGLLTMLNNVLGPKALAGFIKSSFRNTSTTISTVVGPTHKISLENHPVKRCYFTVVGAPQDVVFTIASYMEELCIVATAEKSFIDSNVLISCVKKAFEDIYQAACGINKVELK
ncbi:PREDICTED: O-acyltransferase WSD1-like [Nelumbo nucifera]|uniref:O-acyltransferase WSD1-like n=2 Tax=Nelumbo nucifera TaxID=4432 RepID=A0A1U7YPS5_NELNU|nr:PREDICTED: O-acyltransferase WSD1-like [Nelumbo nucifera]DAD38996.1 TPA_asm: hypothetical protein HUJ06_013319 [Nelumbo nucifera]